MQHKLCTTRGILITVRLGFVWTVHAVWIIIFQLQNAVTRIVVYSLWYRRFCSFLYCVYNILASNDSVINICQNCFSTSAGVIVHRLSVGVFSIFCNLVLVLIILGMCCLVLLFAHGINVTSRNLIGDELADITKVFIENLCYQSRQGVNKYSEIIKAILEYYPYRGNHIFRIEHSTDAFICSCLHASMYWRGDHTLWSM